MPEKTKGGNIIISRLRAPDTVRPGSTYRVLVEVSNGAINTFNDPDTCGDNRNRCSAPGGPVSAALCVNTILVRPDGSKLRSGPMCIVGQTVGTTDVDVEFNLAAPQEPGEYSISAFVRMDGSGKQTDRLNTRMLVSEDAPEDPETPSGGEEFDLANWITSNPVQAGIAGVGGAFIIDRTIDAIFEE